MGCGSSTPEAANPPPVKPAPTKAAPAPVPKTAPTHAPAAKGAGSKSRFFPVYHSFNEGKADDWWAAMMKMTPDDMMAAAKKNQSVGFHNHTFMPEGGDKPIYCLWESEKDITEEEFQTFIDGPDGPGPGVFTNKVRRYMAGGGITPAPFFGGASPPSSGMPGATSGCFYWVFHKFKEGAAERFFGMMAGMTPADMEAGVAKNQSLGFHNNTFVPTGPDDASPIFCIWECKEDTSPEAFQAFIDGPDGPGAGAIFVNECHKVAPGALTPAPAFPAATKSRFFPVYHSFNEGKADDWWAAMMKMTPDDMMAAAKKNQSVGFHNHTFMPEGGDKPIYCLWESEKDITEEEFQTFIDGPDGPGPGVFTNKVRRYMAGGGITPAPFFGGASPPSSGMPGATSGCFYWVFHKFKEGAAERFFGMMAGMTPADMEAGVAKNQSLGFHNNTFVPTGPDDASPIFCIWECKEDTSPEAFQAFIDGPDGPGAGAIFVNECHKVAPGALTPAPAFPAATKSRFFPVYHSFNEGKADDWWAAMMKMTPDDMMAAAKKNQSVGFHNHTFMPEGGDKPIYCLWESEKDITEEEFQTFIDGPDGPGPGVFTNKVRRYMAGGGITPAPFFGGASPPSSGMPGATSGCFYWVFHKFKEGAAERFFGMMAGMTPADMEAGVAKNQSLGFHNNTFVPTGPDDASPIFCIWECKEDTSPEAFQAFIDGPDGPGAGAIFVNECHKVAPGALTPAPAFPAPSA